jgi:hypothetical protein
MAVEISPLRLSRKSHAEKQAKKKWMKIWDQIGSRILKLPPWMQGIVLDDIDTAINNRISVMEMIQNANRKT